MANALESASLVMIPSGYEDGTLGSLKPTDGTGDFTFSRGSNTSATRINEQGYIEKGYENLLLQSNTFSDAAWAFVNGTLTGGQAGYDGTNDAWLFTKSASFGQVRQSISASNVLTCSVYVKLYDETEADSIYFRADSSGGTASAYFNLSTQSVNTPSNIIDSNIESVGDGWFRISMTFDRTITIIRIYPSLGNNTNTTSGSIYIQDAMLNQGLVAYPYIETTTAPVAGGILEDMPRLDWSGSCPSLLLEPSRTNLIEYSEYFGSYYIINSVLNKTDNAANSPEGVQNATLISESTYSSTIPVISTGNRYSLSGYQTATLYVKAENNARYFGISFGSNAQRLRTTFDFENNTFNTIVYNGDVANASLSYEELQNGWYRIIVTANFVTPATGAAYQFAFLQDNTYLFFAFQASDNRQFYIYGLQLEQGSYPTSYIPTYGVSQTRLAEDVELPSLSSVFDSTGDYTILFEVERLSDVNESQFIYLRSSIFNYITLSATTLGRCEIVLYDGTGATAITPNNSFIPNSSIKIAVRISGNTCSAFSNGIELTLNNTSVTPRNFDRYQINRNHRKNQEVYFPTALSDSECIALTTI